MTFHEKEFLCPTCQEPARGTVETIPGVALLGEPVADDGLIQVDYFGETEIEWNGQRSLYDRKGRISLVCVNGHSWWASPVESKSSLSGMDR